MTSASGGSRKAGAAARAEGTKKSRTVEVRGTKFALPSELPFEILRYMSDDPSPQDIVRTLELILGPEQMETWWGLELGLEEGSEVMRQMLELMGLTPGESPASAG